MKKVFITVFAMFYLIISSDLIISYHDCDGKLKSISFFSKIDEFVCSGGKEKSKKCCHEKSSYFKIKAEQLAGKIIKVSNCSLNILSPQLCNQQFEIQKLDLNYNNLKHHSPPVLYENPIYVIQKAFVI